MAERRVDRIRRILERLDGRARVRDIMRELRLVEGTGEISNTAISVAVNAENSRLDDLGEKPLFRTSRNGEEWGWISIESGSDFEPGSTADKLEHMILTTNRKVGKDLRAKLVSMDWRTFETSFLTEVLDKLGFQDVEITQATRDGGADARVTYKRGIVDARAIVSAKRWASKSSVPVEEVRMLRGIKGEEDTAIIITTGKFTQDAKREAQPSQNQRVVYLIDGDRLVEICKRHEIGVKKRSLPEVFVLDEEQFHPENHYEEVTPSRRRPVRNLTSTHSSAIPDSEEYEELDKDQAPEGKLKRFRETMLDELSIEDIARLTGLGENTVRTYLFVPRRKSGLAKRIRENDEVREEALRLVELAREGG